MDMGLKRKKGDSAGKKGKLTGEQRREKILDLMRQASLPLSGSELGRRTGVSRQVVVQDIALLRMKGHPIVATFQGYLLNEGRQAVRLFKVCHNSAEIEDELKTIVDLGGCILDVMVNHRAYGKVTAPLHIKSRSDIEKFMDDIQSGKSDPLMNVTSGFHFHHVLAEREEVLDEIHEALRDKHYLAKFMPYEKMEGCSDA